MESLFDFDNLEEPTYIYEFFGQCYRCKKLFTKYFPEVLAYRFFRAFTLRKVYSQTMDAIVIGNICPVCNAYNGQWFTYIEWMELKSNNEEPNIIGIVIQNITY